ncbi:unnamed protein product [Caenorhabditis bovis]|uniref:Uncharacterized protein n=1 Tax=Caenorhabditis bovis TaxID=2654633 RepID=A0A8S1EUC4_9PELO|nr:unnamed protein product [Caenorhabditis bovis]
MQISGIDDGLEERHWSVILLENEEMGRESTPTTPEAIYTENRRYFSDSDNWRSRHREQNMVEYWVPPETNTKKTTATNGAQTQKKSSQPSYGGGQNGRKSMKIPKVKEPRNENSSKKSSADSPPNALRILYWRMANNFENVGDKIGNFARKLQILRNKWKANKVAPIHTKVQSRHLELEPLCCLSSCLVRGGCTTVIVFELIYIAVTSLLILQKFGKADFKLWSPIPKSLNACFEHQSFYYAILLYDLILFIIAVGTARSLVNFEKTILQIHFYFCFFSFIANFAFLIFSIWTLASPGPLHASTFFNALLIFCFIAQLPLQLWAVTVLFFADENFDFSFAGAAVSLARLGETVCGTVLKEDEIVAHSVRTLSGAKNVCKLAKSKVSMFTFMMHARFLWDNFNVFGGTTEIAI